MQRTRRGRSPGDLDLAVLTTGNGRAIQVLEALTAHLGFERIDVLDLSRADGVARAQALRRGELLHEAVPGTFAEQQMAVVRQADTRWLRDLQPQALAG